MIALLAPALFLGLVSLIGGYFAVPSGKPSRLDPSRGMILGIIAGIVFGFTFFSLLRRFDLAISQYGVLLGIFVSAAIQQWVWGPRIRRTQERILHERLSELGLDGRRAAPLRPRRVRDYIHPVLRWSPGFFYATALFLALARAGAGAIETDELQGAYRSFMYGFIFMLLGEVWIRRNAAAPSDLRSIEPIAFESAFEAKRRLLIRLARTIHESPSPDGFG